MFRTVRAGENFHIVLWLVKDLCWVLDLHLAGVIMIVPTVAMAIWIAWLTRHDTCELFHSLAVVAWIMANGTWMLGEFFLEDGTRPVATVFFTLGLACVAWYHLRAGNLRPRRRRVHHDRAA